MEEAINNEREARREAAKERKWMRERKRGATEKAYVRQKIFVVRERGRSKERRRERTWRGRDEERESRREKKRRKRGRGSPLRREKERGDGIIFRRHYFSLSRAEEGREKRERTKRDERSSDGELSQNMNTKVPSEPRYAPRKRNYSQLPQNTILLLTHEFEKLTIH